MIVGVGSDLANINRIEETISIFGERFLKRSFAPVEFKEIRKRQAISNKEYACSLAKRFAAKEAFAKALGTGFREGVFMKDIAVVHQKSGKPQLKIYGAETFAETCRLEGSECSGFDERRLSLGASVCNY